MRQDEDDEEDESESSEEDDQPNWSGNAGGPSRSGGGQGVVDTGERDSKRAKLE